LTKRFHKCDENCKINHKKKVSKTVVPKVDKKFVETVFGNVPISKKSETKTDSMIEIMNIVDAINNPLETNKVLEKTLITLRKLQQDIA
jgi:hypothetical protein